MACPARRQAMPTLQAASDDDDDWVLDRLMQPAPREDGGGGRDLDAYEGHSRNPRARAPPERRFGKWPAAHSQQWRLNAREGEQTVALIQDPRKGAWSASPRPGPDPESREAGGDRALVLR
ncbi:hypothetical protein ZWY2020_015057 [Hordeum vulgare]|nr:hypothetical protein ZWY2020_015057 [Hordeum vulgare]